MITGAAPMKPEHIKSELANILNTTSLHKLSVDDRVAIRHLLKIIELALL